MALYFVCNSRAGRLQGRCSQFCSASRHRCCRSNVSMCFHAWGTCISFPGIYVIKRLPLKRKYDDWIGQLTVLQRKKTRQKTLRFGLQTNASLRMDVSYPNGAVMAIFVTIWIDSQWSHDITTAVNGKWPEHRDFKGKQKPRKSFRLSLTTGILVKSPRFHFAPHPLLSTQNVIQ